MEQAGEQRHDGGQHQDIDAPIREIHQPQQRDDDTQYFHDPSTAVSLQRVDTYQWHLARAVAVCLLTGLLAAIKAAAEYEQAVIDLYPALADNDTAQEGLRRMGPQLLAHLLVILLIVAGNVIYFWDRRKGVAS